MNLLTEFRKLLRPPMTGQPGPNHVDFQYRHDVEAWIRGDKDPEGTRMEEKVAWWYGGIQKITSIVAEAEIQVMEYKDETYTPILDHPVEMMFRSPNRWQSGRELLRRWCQHLYYYGESYLYFGGRSPRTNNASGGNEMQVIHPGFIEMVRGKGADDWIRRFNYYPEGRGIGKPVVPVDPSLVMMSRFPDPRDETGLKGLAPLKAASMGIRSDYMMSRWGGNFFGDSGGLPQAIVSYPKELAGTPAATAMEDMFVNLTQDSRRDPLLIPQDQLDVKILDFEPDKMGFDKLRGLTRKEIEYILGVPEGTSSDDATRANATTARATLIEHLIWPLVRMLEANLNNHLLHQWPRLAWGLDGSNRFQAVEMRQQDEEQHDKQQKRRESTWSTNEIRAEDDKDPVDAKALLPLFPKVENEEELEALFEDMPVSMANTLIASMVKPKPSPPPGFGGPGGPPDPDADPQGGTSSPDADPGGDGEPGDGGGEGDPPGGGGPPDPDGGDGDGDPLDDRSMNQAVVDLANWRRKAYAAAANGQPLPTRFTSRHIPDYVVQGLADDLAEEGAEGRLGVIFREWMAAL